MNFIFRNIKRAAVGICYRPNNLINLCRRTAQNIKYFHTTSKQNDLMDFFDNKKNWNETNIRVGRGWRLDELRIKSNTDLHKLWYVLLKERNMLFTMEHECNEQIRLFPNPERIDKVEESMNNIETLIRERNIAYYKLETGETGERPVDDIVNLFGLPEKYQKQEYFIPKFMNSRWVKSYLEHGYINSIAVKKFYRLYQEKLYNIKRKEKNRNLNQVQHLLKRFPDMDMEKLQAEYPEVDIEKAKRSKKARGHFLPKY
ncbi:large ribosomal subunit protein uL29m [Maniola hyperantus]|uniref:large ribosomal subunit protein uL29m n=1 Tax=Aphantopus hyperantus TaxID=2795564 RepID=UPI00156871DC|nr:39S ribosomal protein L47, mitochondrial [Maniola hyperantus]